MPLPAGDHPQLQLQKTCFSNRGYFYFHYHYRKLSASRGCKLARMLKMGRVRPLRSPLDPGLIIDKIELKKSEGKNHAM